MSGLIMTWAALLFLAALTGHFKVILVVTSLTAMLTVGMAILHSDDW
jgi:hypothetical protein